MRQVRDSNPELFAALLNNVIYESLNDGMMSVAEMMAVSLADFESQYMISPFTGSPGTAGLQLGENGVVLIVAQRCEPATFHLLV